MSTLLRQEEAIANMARAQNNRFDYSKQYINTLERR